MQQICFDRPGAADVLRLVDAPRPEPRAGELRIRVAAAGVNRADVAQRQGVYAPPPGASDILGLEVSGVVDGVGAGVDAHWLARKVCTLTPGAGYAEWVCVPATHCLPVPAGWSWAEAAAFPEAAMTVWSNVFELGRLAGGESLLVHGGTSGVGACAIALARALGHEVMATASGPAKCQALADWGAHPIDYRREDFVERVLALTQGRGADVILDMVGGAYVQRNLACAAMDARVVQIAFQADVRAEIDLLALMQRRAVLTGSLLRPRSEADKAQIVASLREHVLPLIAAGRMRAPVIDSLHAFDAVAHAHARMESSQHVGKIVLAWDCALARQEP